MSVALHEPMTLEEFLAWEECQPARFEFDGFHPIAVTGGAVAHSRIMRRLHRLLEQHSRIGLRSSTAPSSCSRY
jgi:hypothetical protein